MRGDGRTMQVVRRMCGGGEHRDRMCPCEEEARREPKEVTTGTRTAGAEGRRRNVEQNKQKRFLMEIQKHLGRR